MILFLLSHDVLRQLLRNLGYEVTGARTDPGAGLACSSGRWECDVADVQGGTTAGGIRPGAIAVTVGIVLSCLTGMRARDDALQFDPALPPESGTSASASTTGDPGRRHTGGGSRAGQLPLRSRIAPIKILVRDKTRVLAPGMPAELRLEPKPAPAPITVRSQQHAAARSWRS